MEFQLGFENTAFGPWLVEFTDMKPGDGGTTVYLLKKILSSETAQFKWVLFKGQNCTMLPVGKHDVSVEIR